MWPIRNCAHGGLGFPSDTLMASISNTLPHDQMTRHPTLCFLEFAVEFEWSVKEKPLQWFWELQMLAMCTSCSLPPPVSCLCFRNPSPQKKNAPFLKDDMYVKMSASEIYIYAEAVRLCR